MFGLGLGVIGLALIIGSRSPDRARLLVWTVIGLELVRGIVDDVYMLTRGYEPTGLESHNRTYPKALCNGTSD